MFGSLLGPLFGGAFQMFSTDRAANDMERAAERQFRRAEEYGGQAFNRQRGGFQRAGQAQVRGARRAGNALETGARRAGQAGIAAANEQLGLAGQVRDGQVAEFRPYADAGQNALSAYNYEMGLGSAPAGYRGFQATPGYEFRLNQGLDAITGNRAAVGSSLSGAAAQALMGYGQNLASEEYGGYMDRLNGLAGRGMEAAGGIGNALANYGAAASGAIGNRGAAQTAMHTGIGAARAGTAANVADARANQYTNIGNAGAQSSYYIGSAGQQAAADQGNAAAAGWMGLGNAVNGTMENIYGLNALGGMTGMQGTSAYGINNTAALRGAVGNSNMAPAYQNPWAIW